MNDIVTLKSKTITWNLQAVDNIYINYENGRGWVGSIQYYVQGLKIEKAFFNRVNTLEEKLQEIKTFIESL